MPPFVAKEATEVEGKLGSRNRNQTMKPLCGGSFRDLIWLTLMGFRDASGFTFRGAFLQRLRPKAVEVCTRSMSWLGRQKERPSLMILGRLKVSGNTEPGSLSSIGLYYPKPQLFSFFFVEPS